MAPPPRHAGPRLVVQKTDHSLRIHVIWPPPNDVSEKLFRVVGSSGPNAEIASISFASMPALRIVALRARFSLSPLAIRAFTPV